MTMVQGSYTVRRRRDGVNGINSATVTLYNRTSGTPNVAPNGNTTYNFTTGVLSGSLGVWTRYIPTDNGSPCYVITATAASNTETDTILPADWSPVRKLVSSGLDAITVEIDKLNTSVDANINAFELVVAIKVKRGEVFLTPGTEWDFTHINTGLTDDLDHAGNGASSLVMNFTGFTGNLIKVGYCDITVTVGTLTFERRITISRNAIQGCITRTSEWVTEIEYRNDEALVTFPRYLDIVVFTNAQGQQSIYSCHDTHTSGTFATDLDPGGKWTAMNIMAPIYTPFLVAPNALIKFMQSQQLLMVADGVIQAGISSLATVGIDYRFWSGATQPVDANWSVDESRFMKAFAGKIGNLNIIGDTLFSETIKISENPIDTLDALLSPTTNYIASQSGWSVTEYDTPSVAAGTQDIVLNSSSTLKFRVNTSQTGTYFNVRNSGVYIYSNGNAIWSNNYAGTYANRDFVIQLPAGTYSIVCMTYSTDSSSGTMTASISGEVSDTTKIKWYSYNYQTMIGNNGFYSFWDVLKYFYYSSISGLLYRGSIDIPAGLGGASVGAGGEYTHGWGLAYNSSRTTTTTTIHHNVTDTKFTVDVTPKSSFTWYLSSFTAATSPTANDGTIVIVCSTTTAIFDFRIERTPY